VWKQLGILKVQYNHEDTGITHYITLFEATERGCVPRRDDELEREANKAVMGGVQCDALDPEENEEYKYLMRQINHTFRAIGIILFRSIKLEHKLPDSAIPPFYRNGTFP
jgi:hypothetical protein